MGRTLEFLDTVRCAAWLLAASGAVVPVAACSAGPRAAAPFDATSPMADASTDGHPGKDDSAPTDTGVLILDDTSPPLRDTGLMCSAGMPPTSVPDGSCSSFFQTDLDAGPGGRPVTPADVSCDADSDCMLCLDFDCCYLLARGENRTSTGACNINHKCPPPVGGGACTSGTGTVTQDCKVMPDGGCIGLACVEHVCITYAQ